MDYKSAVKRHSLIITVCIICCVLLLAGTSYALFFQVNTNSSNQVVKTGKLEVSYGSQSKKITDISLYPMSDNDALEASNVSSSVEIENTGSLPAAYRIKIGKDMAKFEEDTPDNSQFVDLQYVKVALLIGDEVKVQPIVINTLPVSSDDDAMFDLYTGTLGIEDTTNVVVKVWLDESITEDEIGKYLYLKLDVTSEVDEANTTEGQGNNN